MPSLEAKSLKHVSEEVDFLANQHELLSAEVVALRRDRRADLDHLTLELEAIKRFLLEAHPELGDRFDELREEVRMEVFPE